MFRWWSRSTQRGLHPLSPEGGLTDRGEVRGDGQTGSLMLWGGGSDGGGSGGGGVNGGVVVKVVFVVVVVVIVVVLPEMVVEVDLEEAV